MLSSIIIGGGPGGLGPLIWAAQHGLLPAWLDRGVAVVERQAYLGGTLGRCGIYSDSLGGSYLECLEASGLPPELQPLIHEPVAREMAAYRDSFPPLRLVDRFQRRPVAGTRKMLRQDRRECRRHMLGDQHGKAVDHGTELGRQRHQRLRTAGR